MNNYTHPHADIQVRDDSIGRRVSRKQRALHRPLFPIQAAKGVPLQPIFVSGPEAELLLGESTFDMFSPYYGNEQFYLDHAIFPYHGAYVVPLPDESATSADIVVELHVTEDDIVQYQRDKDGGLILDEDGKAIPELSESGQTVTVEGYVFKYMSRQLDKEKNETISNVKVRVVEVEGSKTYIYPLFAAKFDSAGKLGSYSGFRLFFNKDIQDEMILMNHSALTFSFEAIQNEEGSSMSVPIRTFYGSPTMTFTAKPDVRDHRTQLQHSFRQKVANNYTDSNSGISLLPYDVYLYEENWKALGELIVASEEDPNLDDPWLVDILGCRDLNGNPYKSVKYDASNSEVFLKESYNVYLEGGDDGDLSREKFEERFRHFLKGHSYPEIQDNFRYPFTHIYDVGYSYKTKQAMNRMMAIRDDFRPILSTQDCSMDQNDRETDYSLGFAIRQDALLTKESLVFGTPCCRAEVYCHSGKSNNLNYDKLLPMTYWACLRRAQTQGGSEMSSTLGGEPNSIVDMFIKDSINNPEYDGKVKEQKFNNGLNYVQYGDGHIIIPDIRGVYTDTTSVLAGSTYVDALIALKYITRFTWSRYSGSEKPSSVVHAEVADAISREGYDAFGKHYTLRVVVDQTPEMIEEGDVIRVRAQLWGNGVLRRFATTIYAKRADFSSSEF